MTMNNEHAARMSAPPPEENMSKESETMNVGQKDNNLKNSAGKLKNGDPLVWAGAAASSITLGLFACLVIVVLVHGLGTFWANDYHQFTYEDGTTVMGAIKAEDEKQNKLQLYIGNRDLYGLDYRWISRENLKSTEQPQEMVLFERVEKGNFLGFLKKLNLESGEVAGTHDELWPRLLSEHEAVLERKDDNAEVLDRMAEINSEIERTRLKMLKIDDQSTLDRMKTEQERRRGQFDTLNQTLDKRRAELRKQTVVMEDASGQERTIALVDITRAYRPNLMGMFDKVGLYTSKVGELLTEMPRESNTEGGLYPAILGTVLMVLLMSVFCVPLGVVAAVYLREYAKEGLLVNLVRIAVNNLAGVPSIVYGMFGLGFFVYGIGGTIDNLFFPERAPLPTFGTGGLLWASLTMALLTVPVVIVSTEEGLSSVPQGVRDGSLALGATKLQTLMRVVMPMATPGILTGLILAIARAAGEVAPLMLVGVVKSVHELPIDGNFPFVKLEHKIMHLGFHIFDVGFQSPNVEAAKPMVYVTTLLLLFLVLGMSFLAMYLRNRMKKRYTLGAF